MSEPTRIPRSSETIQTPRPSCGPAFFALGAIFIGFSYMLLRTKSRTWALRTYLFSLLYLALLFVSMAIAAHV